MVLNVDGVGRERILEVWSGRSLLSVRSEHIWDRAKKILLLFLKVLRLREAITRLIMKKEYRFVC